MTKRRGRSSGAGIKAVFLLGGVAASALSATLIAAQDRQAQAADGATTAGAAPAQDAMVIDSNALPPVPTAHPYRPPAHQAPRSAEQQVPGPAVQAPASASVARSAPPAAPVTSSRSSGG